MSQEPKEFDEVIKGVPNSEKEKELKESAENQFRISESPTFKKFRADLSDNQINEIRRLAPLRTFEIPINGEMKEFTRRKIKSKDYITCEKTRAQLIREKDLEKQTDLQFQLYRLWARFYLDMSDEDFDNSEFQSLKPVLDTCNVVTVQGIPNGT